jgi:putative ABC transport system permease protein
MGAALGIVLAWLVSQFFVGMISSDSIAAVFDLTPNLHVLGFSGAIAIAAAVLFSVAPAFQATTSSVALKDDSRMSRSRTRLLSSLVSVQVAVSLPLLIGAGLFERTLRNLEHVETGFQAEGVLLVNLDGQRWRGGPRKWEFAWRWRRSGAGWSRWW